MVDRERMIAQLELHEGVRCKVYPDTEENLTLGVGYNITARGIEEFERTIGRQIDLTADPCITPEEARAQLVADIQRVQRAVLVHFPTFADLNEVRQRVVLDLAFNLGFRALNFQKCIAAIKRQDWSTAARELFKSRWAYQVDDGPGGRLGRADRLARMLLTGLDDPLTVDV